MPPLWAKVGPWPHTLASAEATFGSAPAKGSGASLQSKRARPRPGPPGFSSAAMKARRTATSLHDWETRRAGGKAQVNMARSGPHGLAGLLPKSWLEGTRRALGGKGPIQHVQRVFPTQVGRRGWAGSQLLQPSSRQMATLFLEFPAKWACGPSEVRRYTDTQVGSSGLGQGGWRPWHSNPQGEEEGQRAEKPWQPSCFFQQWDICGRRKMESAVVTPCG